MSEKQEIMNTALLIRIVAVAMLSVLLVLFASGIDRERGLVVIKPSGVPYESLTVDDLVVLDLDGRVVEGRLNPSSDTPTHIELYKAFPGIGGIVHTHSTYATAWAQAGRDIPCLGTTHADYFRGPVPCTDNLTAGQLAGDYEKAAGSCVHAGSAGPQPRSLHLGSHSGRSRLPRQGPGGGREDGLPDLADQPFRVL